MTVTRDDAPPAPPLVEPEGGKFVQRHGRRAAGILLLLGALVLTGGGTASAQQSESERRRAIDRRLQEAQERLDTARDRERVLTAQVRAYSDRIRQVTRRLEPLRVRLAAVQADAAVLERRLWTLNSSLRAAREAFNRAEIRLVQRQGDLAVRLREVYARGTPDPLLAVLGSGSITDALNATGLLKRIGERDAELVASTRLLIERSRVRRDRVRVLRDHVQREERSAQAAADRVRRATEDLAGERDRLERERRGRDALLARAAGRRADIEAETQDLRRRSDRLAARIRRAQGAAGAQIDPTISSRGMTYPVNGVLTSGFGPRWGRMHEGLDIAVPTGTPVAAAAPGMVLSAGWGGGYGNLVVVDHGGGVATAYAHNSSLSVTAGQRVDRGTVLALAGSTGRSTGPHVHFEVRVNGAATDPIPYL
ncbi:MAG: peptidoglycan DD-metalloendopeptidase family protein [Thermoleophilia bacterium]